jgi:hypothetical protein
MSGLGYGYGGRADFRRYLCDVATMLTQVSEASDVQAAEIPAEIGRRESPHPKIIDEYNWVKMTQGVRTTTVQEQSLGICGVEPATKRATGSRRTGLRGPATQKSDQEAAGRSKGHGCGTWCANSPPRAPKEPSRGKRGKVLP